MRKSLGKVVLAVVIAGLLTGGIAIASAATKVRTVTTPQGTSVDVISVTGMVTEVSTPSTADSGKGFMGMFRRGPEGYAKIKDSADGTVYRLELGREEAAGITMKVGDTVTVEGTSETRNSVNELQIWTFTGADGKTVTLRKADGTPDIETVSVAGTVTEVNVPTTTPSTGDTTKSAPTAMATIKVKQADGTIVTAVIGYDASTITVKVGDAVKIEGFKTPMDANTIMATSFTGADGKAVTLRGLDGMGGGRGIRGENVSVSGMVTEVTQATTTTPSTGDTTKSAPTAMTTIKVKQADGTIVTVVLGHDASTITVKVGDVVKIEGFKTSTDATTIMATSFTGADGKTVTLGGKGFGGCGMRGGRADGQGIGRGVGGGMKGPGSASGSTTPSNM
jgi:primosomal replication protein N